jgi:hypothetical protein
MPPLIRRWLREASREELEWLAELAARFLRASAGRRDKCFRSYRPEKYYDVIFQPRAYKTYLDLIEGANQLKMKQPPTRKNLEENPRDPEKPKKDA